MTQMPPTAATTPDIVLPDEPDTTVATVTTMTVVEVTVVETQQVFDPNSTAHFQAKMSRAPVWFVSIVASNHREKHRFREELAHIKGAWPLLMKQRKGDTWTPEDKVQLKAMVRSASSVSPYLFIWAIPGSMVLLPFLAWFLDGQRKRRAVERRRLKEE
ncbi:hypothetical protein [Polaromonas eurypsychrophila]|uniref:Uncharacterized protein n=1 Tax=Polaromonas eurypsychrophila TaxID=1614635 RepID=A0A916S9L7_9BURK|nr:hypothetical protein [Polaromonas eurypsychrophila]GGA90118.1 hypothetical protein GCM10011496_08720 [Polaromonas eurypsychrophila]